MSKIALSGPASGTATYTISAPTGATDRTITLPDQTGTLLTGSGAIGVNSSAATNSLVIDASGNVGIGTSSPNIGGANTDNAILTLKGKASTRSGIFEMGNFGTTGNDQTLGWNRYFDGSTENASIEVARASSTSTAYMKFSTNGGSGNTERARIDSNGAFGVGMTSPSGYGIVGVRFTPSGGSHNQTGIGIETSLSTSGARFMQFYNEGGSGIGSITRNSTTNAVLYNTSSDYRLKEAVEPLSGALARVSQMRPVRWVWKDCAGAAGEGFIAHELQQVVPGAVTGEKDAVDENGKPIYQGMDASYLVATLTAAIQEQQAIITALTARVTALEGTQP